MEKKKPLTDINVKQAKYSEKPDFKSKQFYERGLFLKVTPSGGKWWRFRYRFDGKEKLLSLGTYPDVSLKDARERRDEMRKQIANNVDPGVHRHALDDARADTLANSFEVVAREWFTGHAPTLAKITSDKIIRLLERDIFPWLGKKPVAEIETAEVLSVLKRIEKRGALYTAHRANQYCQQIFRYAIQTSRAKHNPCVDIKGALPAPQQEHFASITEPSEVGALLRTIDGFKGTFGVNCALRFAPLVFARPGELRKAKWADINLDEATWRYVATKTNTEHLVPLSTQAVAILRDIYPLTGQREYVFPGRDPKKPMSDATINAALRNMGYDTKSQITGHGFRAMARTLLHEKLNIAPEIIEHQLAHRVPDVLGAAYNRTKFIEQRSAMMQTWADYLDELKAGNSNVIRGHFGRAA